MAVAFLFVFIKRTSPPAPLLTKATVYTQVLSSCLTAFRSPLTPLEKGGCFIRLCWRFVKRIISRKGAKTQRKIRYFGLKTPKFFVLIVDLPSIFICLTLAILTLLGNETALPLRRGENFLKSPFLRGI